MTDEFPYVENKVHPKTLNKVLRAWERVLENSNMFSDLSACQLWYACETLPCVNYPSIDRLSFFIAVQDCGVHLTSLLDGIAKYTYLSHRFNRVCQALIGLYVRHHPIPNHWFLQSDILTLPELQHRSDRFQLISESPDAIYLDVSEAFSFVRLLVTRFGAGSVYGNRVVEG